MIGSSLDDTKWGAALVGRINMWLTFVVVLENYRRMCGQAGRNYLRTTRREEVNSVHRWHQYAGGERVGWSGTQFKTVILIDVKCVKLDQQYRNFRAFWNGEILDAQELTLLLSFARNFWCLLSCAVLKKRRLLILLTCTNTHLVSIGTGCGLDSRPSVKLTQLNSNLHFSGTEWTVSNKGWQENFSGFTVRDCSLSFLRSHSFCEDFIATLFFS